MNLKNKIRKIPNFPRKGIEFLDITTLLKNSQAFKFSINSIKKKYRRQKIDIIAAPEARGFMVGAPIAYALNAGFVPVRKRGKLPFEVFFEVYQLEYGLDSLEIHKDAILPGQRVLIIDDLLATGGTIKAVANLIKKLGAEVVGAAFLIELKYLNGRETLKKFEIFSLLKY